MTPGRDLMTPGRGLITCIYTGSFRKRIQRIRLEMNLHIFNHNEIVQVLDETTYIWESAKILGLDSDWSAKVKWSEGA